MTDKKILDNFTHEASRAYNQFCVWMYSNNYFVQYQEKFNKTAKQGLCYSIDECIDSGCRYKNFWDTVIPSLQHSWILSVARLIDPAYFKSDKSKSRLSVYYILELIKDNILKQELKSELNNHKKFTDSVRRIRNNFLAHKSVNCSNAIIEAGVENFFQTLDCIIKKIKNKYPHLKECNDINLVFTKKLSKTGVKEIFEKIK